MGFFMINIVRTFNDRLIYQPLILIQFFKKAVMSTSVTSNAPYLLNLDENNIFIAIQPDFMDMLHMTGFFTLAPQLVAGTRPIYGLLRLAGQHERFTVHPSEH
jgi:hypothetical protein